jgi:hypothetical protein
VLCDRASVQGYEKSQGDILAVSEMADDIQDALLEYQVGSGKSHAAVVSLKLGRILTDDPATGDI